jgi:hypothetical protein
MNLQFTAVELGDVEIMGELSSKQEEELETSLLKSGLECWRIKKACS